MRLLLLTDDYLPHWGGSRVYCHELLAQMARRGDAVCVATRRRDGAAEFDAEQPYRIVRARLPEAAWLRPLRLQALPTYVALLWLVLRAALRMIFSGGRPDFVLAGELVPTGPVAALLAIVLRRPLVLFVHPEGPTTLARTRWQSRLARWVCGRARLIVVSSRNAQRGLTGLLGVDGAKIAVMLPGVTEEHFDERWRATPCGQPGRLRLLSVARLVRRKGHATVIEALPALIERLPGLTYRIVGTGPLEAELREAARRAGVANRVEFARADAPADLMREYAEADCFVLANRDDAATGDTEGFGIVFGEAAAHGLPVVGGRAGGTEDSIVDGETGRRVDGASASAVADAVAGILADAGCARALGDAGRAHALRRFRWSERGGEFATLLERAVQPRPPLRLRLLFPLYLAVIVALALFRIFVHSGDWRHAGIDGADGQAYYAPLRSLWFDHDLDLTNEFSEYNLTGHGRDTLLGMPRSPYTGLLFDRFGVGCSLFLLPFFVAADLLTRAGHALGLWRWAADGYSPLYQFAAVASTLFWAACAYLSTRALLRRYYSEAVAATATFVLFLAFQGIFPATAFFCNPHPHTILVTNLLLLAGLRVEKRRDGLGTWFALGALVGVAALLRTESAVLALFPAILFAWRHATAERRAERTWGVAALHGLAAPVGFALAFLPQAAVWRAMWGRWFVVAMANTGEAFHWTHPVLLSVLFSTRHGLFYWSPVLVPAVAGAALLALTRRGGVAVRCAWAQALVLYYVYASWSIWWMGYSFGARQFLVLTGLFAIGLGYWFERLARHARWLAIASAALIAWNFVLLWLFLNAHIPRDEAFAPALPFVQAWALVRRALGWGG